MNKAAVVLILLVMASAVLVAGVVVTAISRPDPSHPRCPQPGGLTCARRGCGQAPGRASCG